MFVILLSIIPVYLAHRLTQDEALGVGGGRKAGTEVGGGAAADATAAP